jgi:hypothetical protein
MPAKFFRPDFDLQATLEHILEKTWAAFPDLAQTQIAATWIVYDPPYRVNTGGALSPEEFWQYQPRGASYRGVELIYPAGMVSLFYLVAMHVWLEQGMVQPSAEIERAMSDMIVGGSHEATGYVLDVLSGTTSGPELPPGPNTTWQHQRNIVNRYFQQLGWPELQAVNINQKTWCDGPYGRERFFLGEAFENRNLLSTEATARLLHSIVGGVSVSGVRSQSIMALMKTHRVLTGAPKGAAEDASENALAALAAARVWSKTGFSHQIGHSALYVEADNAHPYQLVLLSESKEKKSSDSTNLGSIYFGRDPAAQGHHEAIAAFVSQQIFEASQQAFST